MHEQKNDLGSPRRPILWIILASATLTVMAGAIIAPVQGLMSGVFDVDETFTGLIITTHAISLAVVSPLIGKLIDRIGTKKPYIFGLILYGIAGGSGLLITSYWPLIISRAILGIGVAAVMTTITVMILNQYKGDMRNRVMGWRGSANSFGGIIWPIIGGFLGGFSWQMPFAVYLLGIPLGIIALITVPETHQTRDHQADRVKSILTVIRKNPIIIAIYGLMFFTMVLLYTIVVFLPFKLEDMGISATFGIGLFLSVQAIFGGTTSLMYGWIRSRLSYRMILLIALSLWSIGFSAVSQSTSWPITAASISLFGIGLGMVFPSILVRVGETVEARFRGRAVSYLATFGFVGQFASPLLWKPVNSGYGFNGVFLAAGMTSLIILAAYIFFLSWILARK